VSMKAGLTIVCLCALSSVTTGDPFLQAQNAAPLPQAAAGTTQDSANEIFIAVGKSALIDSARPIQRIAVGLGDIAEATAVSPSEVLVNGRAPGQTSLIVWEEGAGRQFFNVTVGANNHQDRMEALRRELRTELPGQNLKITSENDLIFLRGTVKDLNSSDRAVQIASTAGKVVNLLYVTVPDPDPQILLKVRFASVDRTVIRNLGINIFSTGATNSFGVISTGQFSGPTVSGTIPGSATSPTTVGLSSLLNLFIFRPDLNLGATIEALQNNGVLEVLAEPNLLTANGHEASFLAGGEYPYPVIQGVTGTGTGAITIQFKEFGVRLNFIPTITPRGTIRLQVAPEVSSLDFTDGLVISGFTVPSLDTRKVKTEVELSQGQSFAIGGLLDNRVTQNLYKIPFIGDIPILGKFFQSIQKTRMNTELIVIVTPEIVAPMKAGAPLPELNYPVKFLPPNTGISMSNPGEAVQPAHAPATMPVEQLIQSMQPEQPLIIDSMTSGGGNGSSSQSGASSGSGHP